MIIDLLGQEVHVGDTIFACGVGHKHSITECLVEGIMTVELDPDELTYGTPNGSMLIDVSYRSQNHHDSNVITREMINYVEHRDSNRAILKKYNDDMHFQPYGTVDNLENGEMVIVSEINGTFKHLFYFGSVRTVDMGFHDANVMPFLQVYDNNSLKTSKHYASNLTSMRNYANVCRLTPETVTQLKLEGIL